MASQVRLALVILASALRIAFALNNGLAEKPIMGYNTWNAFGGNIDEELIHSTIARLVELGLADVGYTYFSLDDAWSEPQRNASGALQANSARFPSGMATLADHLHGRGLKFGIYGDAGSFTCLGFPGSRGYEQQDAATWAAWGVDLLKYDNCAARDDDWVVARYTAMRDALNRTGRPLVFSLCEWGVQAPWLWGPAVGNSWRTTVDIKNSWDSVLANLDSTIGLARFAGPGSWNDPDMLQVGNGQLTPGQERAHFALWALLKAPLLIGADLRKISATSLAVLKAREVVAVHQDDLGVAGELVWKQGPREVYAAPLSGGGRAVVFFNRHLVQYRPTRITVRWSEVGLPADVAASVRDLYGEQDLGEFRGSFTAEVKPMDVVVVRLTPLSTKRSTEQWRPWHGQRIFAPHAEDQGLVRPGGGDDGMQPALLRAHLTSDA